MSAASLRRLIAGAKPGTKVNVPGVGMRSVSTVRGYISNPKKLAAAQSRAKAGATAAKKTTRASAKTTKRKPPTARQVSDATSSFNRAERATIKTQREIKRIKALKSSGTPKRQAEIARLEALLKKQIADRDRLAKTRARLTSQRSKATKKPKRQRRRPTEGSVADDILLASTGGIGLAARLFRNG